MPEAKVLTNSELSPAMKEFFEARYRLDTQIDALKAQHIQKIADDRKALIRDFKAMSNLDTEITDPMYKLFKVKCNKASLESAADRARGAADLKRAFTALAKGEILDWLTALGIKDDPAPETEESPFGDDEGALNTGEQSERAASELRPLSPAKAASRTEPEPEPDPAWGATDQALSGGIEHSDAEGHAYQEGFRFGQAGNLDVKSLIKQKGLRRGSTDAISMTAGHAKGFSEWESANVGGDPATLAAVAQQPLQDGFHTLGH